MLILELMTSLMLWIAIMLPINSYLLGISESSPYKLVQEISNQTIFDATKISSETLMNRSDLCESAESISEGDTGVTNSTSSTISYVFYAQNIPVKSTSTEAVGIVSDGQNLFVSLNSASTTDYDLVAYGYNDITNPLDKIDSGPGIIGTTFVGKNLFAINSSCLLYTSPSPRD